MKKLAILTLFISAISFGQFFEQYEPEYQGEESQQGLSFQPYSSYDYTQGMDSENPDPNPGGVDPQVPIDNWLLLLPIAGIAIGVYWLRKKSKLTA